MLTYKLFALKTPSRLPDTCKVCHTLRYGVSICVYMSVCVYVSLCLSSYACMCVSVCLSVHVLVCICCACMCVSVWVWVRVCKCFCLSLCVLLRLPTLGCVFISICLCEFVCTSVSVCLSMSVCVCLFVFVTAGDWMPAEWRQMYCHKSQREMKKWAETGGSQGPDDSGNVRLQESDDIFARPLEFPQDWECGWE